MNYAVVVLALLAGLGIGGVLGMLMGDRRLGVVTALQERTIEKVATNVAHPGARERVNQAVMATEALYNDSETEENLHPGWMDEDFDPFDTRKTSVNARQTGGGE